MVLPAVIDIWRIQLTISQAMQNSVGASAEREQARAAMMRILGAYLGRAASELVVERPATGKPRVASPDTNLQFNLSHTRGMALLVVADGIDVGIDIETNREIPNRLAMARRVFPEPLVEHLGRLDGSRQNLGFLSAWTAMEARQKAFGRGIFASTIDAGSVKALGFVPATGWLAHVAVDAAAGQVDFRYFDATGP
jgi:phosphopantetheinyl transferase